MNDTPSLRAPLFLALLVSAPLLQARTDSSSTYDENSTNLNTIEQFFTNHPGGFSGFTEEIARAYELNQGGVLDEFRPSGVFHSFVGENVFSGYGRSGYAVYPGDEGSPTGPLIEFISGKGDWSIESDTRDTPGRATPISFENYWALDPRVQEEGVTYSITDGKETPLLRGLGFTVLAASKGDLIATITFDDDTAYTESFTTGGKEDIFFGGAAPEGRYITGFRVRSESGNTVFLDDVAISTTMRSGLIAAPVPEPAALGLSMLGLLTVLGRRRRTS